MINQKESKQVSMDTWLLKLLLRNMKKKLIIKNNTKVKAMGNMSPTMDYYPRNGQMGDTEP